MAASGIASARAKQSAHTLAMACRSSLIASGSVADLGAGPLRRQPAGPLDALVDSAPGRAADRLVENKFYVDELYDALIVRPSRGSLRCSWGGRPDPIDGLARRGRRSHGWSAPARASGAPDPAPCSVRPRAMAGRRAGVLLVPLPAGWPDVDSFPPVDLLTFLPAVGGARAPFVPRGSATSRRAALATLIGSLLAVARAGVQFARRRRRPLAVRRAATPGSRAGHPLPPGHRRHRARDAPADRAADADGDPRARGTRSSTGRRASTSRCCSSRPA